ncbi:uncharacterized protein PAC_07809 [Phialocephala subalpina]|uniref:Uncharacterized protein n=1 Tax=Phialocephala subalpina TaxID=576137 RepID=A0A1L7WYS4_9HELO|nr:uncharacterized protein PAC_07809 [Phialocephala subalpina]
MLSTKSKRSSKPPKPDCKVWVQVGDELLPEYLNKPIEIEGVRGSESYLVVALRDVLTLHCQAKPGIVDEFVLIPDGIIRAVETRRQATLVFDKAIHANIGRGKAPGAAFRSDMVIQSRNQGESRLAESGQEPSKVGTIIVEGWRKKTDAESTDSKDGETLKFPTYEDSREWYNVNRLVDPRPGYLPPFEIGFQHAHSPCPKKSGVRDRADNAGNRKTSEWELTYEFIFHYRSATEMHKLGLPDVPIRDPANDLFADESAEEEAAEEATDDEDVAEPEAEEEEAEEEAEETAEKIVEKPKEKSAEKLKEQSIEKPEKPAEKLKEASKENGDLEADEATAKKNKRKPSVAPTVPQQTVSGLLNIMANSGTEVSEGAEPGPTKRLTSIPEEQESASPVANSVTQVSHPTSQVSKKSASDSQPQNPELPSSKDGQVTSTALKAETEGGASLSAHAAPKKMSLAGLKSAPASRAARDMVSTQGSVGISASLGSGQVLPTMETPDGPMTDRLEEQPAKKSELPKSLDESGPELTLVTPPPSIQKNQPNSHLFEAPGAPHQQTSLPISSSADNGRDMARMEARNYAASSTDTTSNHFQRYTVPKLSMDAGVRGKSISIASNIAHDGQVDQRPASRRASVLSNYSDASNAATEIANDTEVQASVKNSQRATSSSSVKTEMQSQVSMRQNALSDSMTPEPRYHSVPSPILGSPTMSHVMYIPKEVHARNPAKQAREGTPDDSPSTQLRHENTSLFGSPPSQSFKTAGQAHLGGLASKLADKPLFSTRPASTVRLSLTPQPETLVRKLQTIELRRQSLPTEEELLAHQKKLEDRSRLVFLNSDYGHQSLTPQPVTQANKPQSTEPRRQSITPQPDTIQSHKRKADDTTGNGSVDDRPRKTSVAPANRAIHDTLRRQKEENERLEKELKDLREYNATLESIRELRRQSEGVKQRIGAEKARQAALEAELSQ